MIADGTTEVEWAVLDLFSQAEHDASAQAILISTDRGFLQQAAQMIKRMLPTMQRADIIRQSLTTRGALIYCEDREQALAVANRVAAEHLNWPLRTLTPGLTDFVTLEPYLLARTPVRLLAITWGPPTCCQPSVLRVLRRHWACMTSKNAVHHSHVALRGGIVVRANGFARDVRGSRGSCIGCSCERKRLVGMNDSQEFVLPEPGQGEATPGTLSRSVDLGEVLPDAAQAV